jgi:uroporphyrinogen decarboxylase
MITLRQRYLQVHAFGNPDKIPLMPGNPRESTLAAWRRQGLPAEGDWRVHLYRELGLEYAVNERLWVTGADFRMMPQFEEKVLEHRDGHYVVQDWKGNVCEISDEFDVTYLRSAKDFVTRRWIRCPVESREDWERMKPRYALDAPGRFAEDFDEKHRGLANRDRPLAVAFSGPFWQLREWCGFEGLCMMMIEQPELVAEMAAFWCDFVDAMLTRIFAVVVPDEVYFSEDMAYKAHAMISPAMTREFCMPSWRKWAARSRSAGVEIVSVDSDGFVEELIPLWIESGVIACDPMEVAAHNDIVAFREKFGRAMVYRGGVDKREMAKGGENIRRELKRIEPVIQSGGFIPGCDHGVPNDVSWPNYVDYCRELAKMTGWL